MLLQSTDMSDVDIWTKCGITHPHYMLISHLSLESLEGVLVALIQTTRMIAF